MAEYLTAAQKLVLATIKELTRRNGKSPTLEELRAHLNYSSTSSVQRHLIALKSKGYIQNKKHHARSLEVPVTHEVVEIPLVGNVACGQPLLAVENIEAYIPYEREKLLGSPSDFFFLRAVGDSMNKAGIDDGDFVLIKKQASADFGKKVVALIGDEATIKTLKKGDGFVVLEPESTNPQNKPIYLFDDFIIQGIVKDVIKAS
jgi:repressor LexA